MQPTAQAVGVEVGGTRAPEGAKEWFSHPLQRCGQSQPQPVCRAFDPL